MPGCIQTWIIHIIPGSSHDNLAGIETDSGSTSWSWWLLIVAFTTVFGDDRCVVYKWDSFWY